MTDTNPTGYLRTTYIPVGLDEKIESVRKRFGWSRSYFYKYALTRFLEELTLLREAAHEKAPLEVKKHG